MPTVGDQEVLDRWCPMLRYDRMAVFFSVAVEAMTDAPGNRVVRGGRTLAAASGVPLLSVDWLKRSATSEGADAARKGDRFVQGADRLGDAQRFQADERFRDRCYGQVGRGDDGEVQFLQYWFLFYGTPVRAAANQDGASWRVLQIDFEDGRPTWVWVMRTTSGIGFVGQALQRTRADPDPPPVVFVSALTHNFHFQAGEANISGTYDPADGLGREVTPTCRLFPGWEQWPGHYGPADVFGAPSRGPSAEPGRLRRHRWPLPAAATAVAAMGLWSVWLMAWTLARRRPPHAPVLEGRLEAGRVVVRTQTDRRRRTAQFVVLAGEQVVASEYVRERSRVDERAIAVPDGLTRCRVRVVARNRFSERQSDVTEIDLTAGRPDDLESALLARVVGERLARDEVRRYVRRLNVDEPRLQRALGARSAGVWTRVLADLQAFRRARFEHTRAEEARRERTRALRIVCAWVIAGLAMIGGIVATFVLDQLGDLRWWVAGAGAYVILLALIGASTSWRRFREQATPAHTQGETPLADARREFERALGEKAVATIIREHLNAAAVARYDGPLEFGDEGLPELALPELEISTRATEELADLTRRMRGGSIGLAGPRGAGKTTLLESFCAPQSGTDRRLTTVISAPVRYDARDFVLTLFAQLCVAVLGAAAQPGARPPRVGPGRIAVVAVGVAVGAALFGVSTRPGDNSVWEALLLAGGATAIGVAASVACGLGGGRAFATAVASVAVLIGAWIVLDVPGEQLWDVVAGVGVLAGVMLLGWLLAGNTPRAQGLISDEELLAQRAGARLREIRYQQTFAQGYAGKLAIPLGGEVSTTVQDTLAERQVTLPELVNLFRDFLRLATRARGQVVIGIDELDKMESADDAQSFLNAIKMIFGLDGVFFLVSISENAMSRFDQRGLPFRDVFDSSFDDVIAVGPLTLVRSKLLLRSRVVALAPPYEDLCHCLSGGLPRDLLRVARQLSLLNNQRRRMPEVAHRLLKHDLERKIDAASRSIAGGSAEAAAALHQWLRDFRYAPFSVRTLEVSCRSRPAAWPQEIDAALARTHLEIAAYAYYLATVLKLFTQVHGDPAAWFSAVERERKGGSRIDRLGHARAAFGADPLLAVAIVNEFRRAQWPAELPPWTDAERD